MLVRECLRVDYGYKLWMKIGGDPFIHNALVGVPLGRLGQVFGHSILSRACILEFCAFEKQSRRQSEISFSELRQEGSISSNCKGSGKGNETRGEVGKGGKEPCSSLSEHKMLG